MEGEFIKPNWHVLLVHYPIALVTVGFIAELFGAVFRRPGLRYSARWMIAIGALLSLPTAVLGLYAFRDVVAAGPIDLGLTWSEVVAASDWSRPMYDQVWWHVWLNAASTVLLVLVAVIWIASSPAGRARGSFPILALTFLAVGLMAGGAWFGGELVYGHGVGVLPEAGMPAGAVGEPEWLRRYLSPLQVHLLGGGFLAAFILLSIAQSLRFWRVTGRSRREALHRAAMGQAAPIHPDAARTGPAHLGPTHTGPVLPDELFAVGYRREEEARLASAEGAWTWRVEAAPSTGAVRALWAAALVGGVAVVAGGLWSMLGSLATDQLERFVSSLGRDQRVTAHFIAGAALVLLPLIPFTFPRLLARSRFLAGSIVLGLTLLLAAQVYVGTLMLYDGHAGPLTGFATRPARSPVAPDPWTDGPTDAARPIEATGPRDRWDDDR